ncbi:MAG: hypothetical protein WDW38_007472 [Sanguina aurantia]
MHQQLPGLHRARPSSHMPSSMQSPCRSSGSDARSGPAPCSTFHTQTPSMSLPTFQLLMFRSDPHKQQQRRGTMFSKRPQSPQLPTSHHTSTQQQRRQQPDGWCIHAADIPNADTSHFPSSSSSNGSSSTPSGSSNGTPHHPTTHPQPTSPSSNGSSSGHTISSNGSGAATAGYFAGLYQSNSEPSSSVRPPLPGGRFPHRWRVVTLMAIAFVLCNMDKVNMSVAVIPMAKELGWSATDRGLVSSSFFWGYSLTQIPAGWISTKIGGARVLMAGVALCRVLVGLGEGFAPSAATAVLAKTVPPTERARAVTTVWGGLDVGSAVGLLLAAPLIRIYGWPSVFYLFAGLGLLWCLVWPLVRPGKRDPVMETLPEEPRRYATESTDSDDAAAMSPLSSIDIKAGAAVLPVDVPVPWASFLASRPVWALTFAHFCFNWGYYTLLAWLPSYFELALGLNVEKSSFLTLIPYVAMVCMTPLVGPVADGLVKKGMSLTRVRKICQGIAFVGPALCMLACATLSPAGAAPGASPAAVAAAQAAAASAPVPVLVLLLSLAFALGACMQARCWASQTQRAPCRGVLGVTAAGLLLDATNSWALALFLPTACCQLLGALIYSLYASSERQPWS